MLTLHKVSEVVNWRKTSLGDRNKISIGFVPTMGCLHEGHASLIKKSKRENDYTVVSIFVNPSQFAPGEDLDKYPRTLHDDKDLLMSLGVDVLFAPNASEMYPQGIPLKVDEQKGPFVTVLGVSEMLEGKTRPNFFRGVATVVIKLLHIVSPDVAYFGQKDIQQFVVLKTMTTQLFMDVRLEMGPIVRDSNGLALSSRNKYLCPESLNIASNIYKGLDAARHRIEREKVNVSRADILDLIQQEWAPFDDFIIDYVSVADLKTLTEVESISQGSNDKTPRYVLSCAVYVKDKMEPNCVVRLIDNILI